MTTKRDLQADKRWLEREVEEGNEMEVERIAVHAVECAIVAETKLAALEQAIRDFEANRIHDEPSTALIAWVESTTSFEMEPREDSNNGRRSSTEMTRTQQCKR